MRAERATVREAIAVNWNMMMDVDNKWDRLRRRKRGEENEMSLLLGKPFIFGTLEGHDGDDDVQDYVGERH